MLEDWEMTTDGDGERPAAGARWWGVKCDTPLVNRGANVFEGAAWFRARVQYPGGQRVLRCEAVGEGDFGRKVHPGSGASIRSG